MVHRPDKEQSAEIHTAIRRVLLQSWDPIGIGDEPHAQDEYDGYIPEIYKLLLKRAPEKKIVDYLLWVVTERMGFTRSETAIAHTNTTVQELIRIPFPAD